MTNKLIITKLNENIISAIYENNDMVQVNVEPCASNHILGNIYIGKVKNIVKNINAAFIEIGNGQMGYLSLSDARNPLFTNIKNNTNINIGDNLIVQVERDGIKTKAPVLTTNISFTGKYGVLIHGKSSVGISSKIGDEKERTRLRKLMEKYRSEQYGLILRTNAANASDELIKAELDLLKHEYETLLQYGVHKSVFSLLYQTPPDYISGIKDIYGTVINEIVTDDMELYNSAHHYLELYQKEDITKLHLYEDKLLSLANLYSVSTKLEHALREKVWLKSGGTIIIQPTEALTVIDVNTGKAIHGKKDKYETFYKINKEAAVEIAKQIRLRNISGIIIIDFINMEKQEQRDDLLRELERLFKKDPIKTTLVGMTSLNLVEVTRKKLKRPLLEQMKQPTKDSDEYE